MEGGGFIVRIGSQRQDLELPASGQIGYLCSVKDRREASYPFLRHHHVVEEDSFRAVIGVVIKK